MSQEIREITLYDRRMILAPVIGCVLAISFVTWRNIRTATALPVDVVLTDSEWADESSCIDCHEQAELFHETGHAQTLIRAEDAESRQLLLGLLRTEAAVREGTAIQVEGDRLVAVNTDGEVQSRAVVDWCVGSGHHARTWISTLEDSRNATDLLEFRWTWFNKTKEFSVTPGQPDNVQPGHFGGLGLLFDQPKAWKCFACHATHVPVDNGRIIEKEIHPGVTCQRCHGPLRGHVENSDQVSDKWWRSTDRMDSVHRCAQCHRRAEEHEPTEITEDNPDIVRFQPVGLTQSRCFSMSRMTCITCHDPHLPMEKQDSLGDWQCIQCHQSDSDADPECHAGHLENCVSCHMPKRRMHAPISFTDHWIRAWDPKETQP